NPRGGSAAGYGGAQNRVGNVNQGQARLGQARTVKCYNCNGFSTQCGQCVPADDYDAFNSNVDEAPTAQTMFMANLSSADHDFKTRQVLLCGDSTCDLYLVTKPSTIPYDFLPSQYTWNQRLGHPGINPNPVSTHPMVTRFRVGTNRPTQRLSLHVSSIYPLPKSYVDAFNDPNWHNAMTDEYNALIKNNTWTLIPRPTEANVVWCVWLFRHKYLADGTLSRYKTVLWRMSLVMVIDDVVMAVVVVADDGGGYSMSNDPPVDSNRVVFLLILCGSDQTLRTYK
nr:ribonuclease H-like domain-containing protein [Tanacetum cinerariifolium]